MSVCSPPSHFHLSNAVVSHGAPEEVRVPLQCPQNPKPCLEPLKLVASNHSPIRSRGFRLNCLRSDAISIAAQNAELTEPKIDGTGGDDGGDFSGGGGGGGGEGGGNEEDAEGEEFGPLLRFDEVMKETEARGVELPLDMLEAAKTTGLRKEFLLRYLALQV